MLNLLHKDGTSYVQLTELYEKLELNPLNYSKFIKQVVRGNQYAEEGKEFSSLGTKTTERGGRPKEDFILTLQFAKEIIMLSKSKVGKKYRDWLISLETKVENNELLSIPKIALLYKMIETFKFAEYQIKAEELHKDRFILSNKVKGNIHKLFAENRNEILGIDNEMLKQELISMFQKGLIHKPQAKNIRNRISLIDKYKLVRNAVIDYLISIQVNTHDAITFAETVMEVAKITQIEIKIKDEDNLFDEKENVQTPLELINLTKQAKLIN